MVANPATRDWTGRSSQYAQDARYGFTVSDVLTTTDNLKIPAIIGQNDVVSQADAQVRVAPVGAAIHVAILLILRSDGSTVSTLGTVTIADGALESGGLTFTPTIVDSSHAIAIAITQVGSGTAGSTLTVIVS